MKKAILLLMILPILLTGCIKKTIEPTTDPVDPTYEEPDEDAATDITIGEIQYIKPLEPIRINGTEDYFTITKKVKWWTPKEGGSFVIIIPYTINVDGIEYECTYQIGSSNPKSNDDNPKYNFEVKNLTKAGDIAVLITEKDIN